MQTMAMNCAAPFLFQVPFFLDLFKKAWVRRRPKIIKKIIKKSKISEPCLFSCISSRRPGCGGKHSNHHKKNLCANDSEAKVIAK
jgi:hypothetical protein